MKPTFMKSGITFTGMRCMLVLLLICMTPHIFANMSDSTTVEGLLYLDGTPVSLKLLDGKIVKITRLSSSSKMPAIYVAPGLVDIQINGYMGVNFADQELTVEKMRKATLALWKEGVTCYLATLTTSDHNRLERSFSLLAKALEDEAVGMSVPGFHLEGPYISPVKGFRGAHSEKYIRLPDWNEFQEFQESAHNKIDLITVAPEMEGAIPFIEKCSQSGVVVALGHHNANSETISQAVDAGACLATHLGNGCANEINRHNNPLWPQLANESIHASIISDGAHLNRDEVVTFYKVKGAEKTILVSDAVSLAGLRPGVYVEDGDTLLLTENVVMFPAEKVLAGAAQPISKCVGNIMKFTGCSLKDAIQMASTNPAHLIGLGDRGEIKIGKRADLILFTLEDGNMVVQKTIIAGKVVYSK
jgi:N-acetylglucosamine-6-phosphate deacetylase